MRVLFDTNVLLDVLLSSEPHAEPAARLLSLADTGRIQGVLSATTVTRNGKDFARATLPILDPPELLAAVLAAEL